MTSTLNRLSSGLHYSGILAKSAVLHAWDQAASRRYLLTALGQVPGLSAKAAQLLAMRIGEDTSADPLALEPMPLDLVKARIEAESPALHRELQQIHPAARVASLGQVHRACLRSGEEIAIKIQFPNLHQSIDQELELLASLSKLGPPKKFRFEMDAILAYFRQSFLEELDYCQEARWQVEAARSLPTGWPIRIARVYPEYSGPSILVQSYEPSVPLTEIRQQWSESARRQCAENLLAYFLDALFRVGLLHTDPHPGNLGFRPAKGLSHDYGYELVLYDFGSMMRLGLRERTLLWQMIKASREQKDYVPFDYLCALGFDAQKLTVCADRLPAVFKKLWEPFASQGTYDFSKWQLQANFEQVLGDERWWFRSAGPAWFLMLMRATQGMLHAIEQLSTRVYVGGVFADLNLNFEEIFVSSQQHQLDSHNLRSMHSLAQKLCVQVCDALGNEIVSLEMPAEAIDELEDIIPPETLMRMQEQKLDLIALKRKVQSSGYVPQPIFSSQTADRRYRVWLR